MEAEDRCFVQHVEEGDELREMAARLAASGRSEAGALYRRFSQIVSGRLGGPCPGAARRH